MFVPFCKMLRNVSGQQAADLPVVLNCQKKINPPPVID